MGLRNYKGYDRSENGWPIVDTADIVTTQLPGMNNVRIELLKGDVTTVLVAWLTWYHLNVEPIDLYQPRDEWGYSWDNLVPNSNHLSGTGVDVNATQYPWGKRVMPQGRVDLINQGLRLFEDNIYHGRNWDRADEMHFQINGYNPGKLAAFAKKLKDGYLGIYKPADPNAFPLPGGWFYGPLEGPAESVSGLWHGDLPAYREGLKRWQTALSLPATGVWDAATADAGRTLQKEMGWPISGYVYEGEWNVVIKDGKKLPVETFPLPPVGTENTGVYWADVSQYQPLLDDSYPHRVVSFRSNSGDKVDTNFAENYRRALDMSRRGKIDAIIVYYFFRPGQANCDLWRELVTVDGKIPANVVCMVDVEGAPLSGVRTITGDQSAEVNDEVRRLREWTGDSRRVIGYHNQKADPDLWKTKPGGGIRMVVPWYNNDVSRSPEYVGLIAHQYSDKVPCAPFGPCDANFSNLRLSQLLEQLGVPFTPPAVVTPPPSSCKV